jgi:hypothetical protein
VLTAIEGWGPIGQDTAAVAATVRTIRARPGQDTEVRVSRADLAAWAAKPSAVSARASIVLTLTPDASASLGGAGSVGLRLQPNLRGVTYAQSPSVAHTARLATQQLVAATSDVAETLGQAGSAAVGKVAATVHLLGSGHEGSSSSGSGSTREPLGAVSGPLGVVRMGAEVAAGGDPFALLAFAAAISASLRCT